MLLYLSLIDKPEDKEKFEKIYYLYRKRMIYTANGVLHDIYESEDAVQNALLLLAQNIDRIEEAKSLRTEAYVLISARNAAIDIYRVKNKKKSTVSYDSKDTEADLDNILDGICSEEKYTGIINCISELDDIYRDTLYLHYVEAYTVSEIAVILNRKKATVKKQIIRGKQLLIENMKKEGII